MTERPLLREGDSGPALVELQANLRALGADLATEETAGQMFGPTTAAALRAFQEQRGLRADGVCGPQTWSQLSECSRQLGDRLLSYRQPMLRGDDVATLQRQLNALGFDAGREDGIFGLATQRAARSFQQAAGLSVDGIVGPATVASLMRLGSLAGGSVATVRERERLRSQRNLTDWRVMLAGEPGFNSAVRAAASALTGAGVEVAWASGVPIDAPELSGQANAKSVGLVVAFTSGASKIAYFGTRTFRSESSHLFARSLGRALSRRGLDTAAVARTYPILRETRMAAIVCELPLPLPIADDELAATLLEGLREAVEGTSLDG